MLLRLIKYPLLTLGIFLLTACHSNNDDDLCCAYPVTLQGNWSLTHVQGGFAGVDDTITHGLIIWHFNTETHTVTVTNNNTDDTILYDGLESGSYTYDIVTENDVQYLHIQSNDFGRLAYTAFQLTLDGNMGADGFLLTFKR
ncbi:MAG: hypothetical protein GYB39_07825 [Algicola sp.]|nr:hypothetical protein [Algicola sp.]